MIAASLVLLALVSGVIGITWGLVEARKQAEATRAEEEEQRGVAERETGKAVAAAEQVAVQLAQIGRVNTALLDIFAGVDTGDVPSRKAPRTFRPSAAITTRSVSPLAST